MDNLIVLDISEFVYWKKALVGVEREMARIIVREIECAIAVADNEKLKKAQDGFGVTVSGISLIFDDLLDGAARVYAKGLQFDLNDRHAIDEQDNVIAMMAVVRVDAKLADRFEGVLAPVFDVDERVV